MMRRFLLVMLFLCVTSVWAACPVRVQVAFTAPTQNADGTPLTDLGGYRLCWATSPIAAVTDCRNSVYYPATQTSPITLVLTGVPAGDQTVYFAMSALDTSGNESALALASDPIVINALAPDAVQNVNIGVQ